MTSALARRREPRARRRAARSCACSCSPQPSRLLGAMILFVGHSLRTMTSSATAERPARLAGPGRLARSSAKRRRATWRGRQACSTRSRRQRRPSRVRRTSRRASGRSAPAPARSLPYRRTTWRTSRRSDSCAALFAPARSCSTSSSRRRCRLEPGDLVTIVAAPGRGRRSRLRVGGIALVTAPDVLFQPLNPRSARRLPSRRPNIAILPFDTFAREVRARAADDRAGGASLDDSRRRRRGSQWQVQAQVDPGHLTGSPAHALAQADADSTIGSSAIAARARCGSSTTSRTRSTPPPATRSTPRRSTSCWRFRGRSSRSGLPTSRRSARSSATGATRAAPRARRVAARPARAGGVRERCSSGCSRAWSAAAIALLAVATGPCRPAGLDVARVRCHRRRLRRRSR